MLVVIFLLGGSLAHDHFIIPTPIFLSKSSIVKWRSWCRHGRMAWRSSSHFVKGCPPWWRHKLQWRVYIEDYQPFAYHAIENTAPKLTYKLLSIYSENLMDYTKRRSYGFLHSKQGIQEFSQILCILNYHSAYNFYTMPN